MITDSTIEYDLRSKGYVHIAGIDEVGRGSIAGPVVAAAVIFPPIFDVPGLQDSKKLSPKKRLELFDKIHQKASAIGIGVINNHIIDEVNILQATFLAMKRAIKALPFPPDFILVDGNKPIPDINIKQKTLVHGDNISASISAASVIAKVTRDRIMQNIHNTFPAYDFFHNKGYGTAKHKEAVFKYNLSPVHRKSFSIAKQLKLF